MKQIRVGVVIGGLLLAGLVIGLGATGMAAATTAESTDTGLETQDNTTITTTESGEIAPTDDDTISWARGASRGIHTAVDDGDSQHAKMPLIAVGSPIEVGPDSGHMLEVTNDDTGESVELVFAEEGTLEDDVWMDLYEPNGELLFDPVVDDIAVTAAGDETTFMTDRVAEYQVTLYEDGVEQGTTAVKPHAIGYTLDATVDEGDDTIEIAIPRDEMPQDAVTTLDLGVPEDELVNDPLQSATLEYDADRDVFYATFDSETLERDEYSWRVEFYDEEANIDDQLVLAFGFDPLAVGADDGDDGDDEDPIDGVNVGLEPADQTVDAGEQAAFDIVVEGATDGIDAYEAVIELTESDVATIEAYTHEQDPTFDDTRIEADGDRLNITAAMGANPIAGADEITLGTMIVEGDTEGETVLDADDVEISQDGERYDVNAVADGTLTVEGEITDPALSLGLADETIDQGEDTELSFNAADVTNGVSGFDVILEPDEPDRVDLSDVEVEGDADPTVDELDNGSLVIGASPDRANGDLELATLTVTGVELGDVEFSIAEVSVRDADGDVYDPRELSGAALTVADAGETINVDLRAADDEVPVDTTTTVDVVIEDAGGGIGGYAMDIAVANESVTTITDFEYDQDPQFPDTELADDGNAISLGGAMGDNAYPPTNETAIVTLTLQADAAGEGELLVDEELRIDDTDGNTYDVGAVSGTAFTVVTGPPPVVGEDPPQDLNGDGNFEDVDGDGEFDIFDVSTLYNNLDSEVVQDNSEAFDFAGDDPDEVTIFDVAALYNQLQERDE